MIVIDASVLGPLLLPDERETLAPERAAVLFASPLIVPGHWHLEVASILRKAVRRGRIQASSAYAPLHREAMVSPEVDEETHRRAWSETLTLAQRHDLTPYDAAYLELALRRRASLARLDDDLRKAAEREGVILVPLE